MNDPATIRLLGLDELPPTGVVAVRADLADGPRELIVVRDADGVRAFLNSCPHLGLRLDWSPGVLLDRAGRHLQCAVHGALFRPGDGHCVAGPCAGARLIPAAVFVRDGAILLDDDGRIPACAVTPD